MSTKDTKKPTTAKQTTAKKADTTKKTMTKKSTSTKSVQKAAIQKTGIATEKRNEKFYDVIVVGAGVAGLSAAIEAGSYNKQVALLGAGDLGGRITHAPSVYGIPGLPGIDGKELAANLFNHVSLLSTVDYIRQNAIYINYRYGMFRVTIDDKSLICGKSIIFATGKSLTPGYCEKLYKEYFNELSFDIGDNDDEIFAGKDVVVYGNEKEAAEYALELSRYCNKVYILPGNGRLNLWCPPALADKVLSTKNIQFLANSSVYLKTLDPTTPHTLRITAGTGSVISCSRVYMPISQLFWSPANEVVGIFADKDNEGYIISSDTTTEKVPGVFAAGSCRTGSHTVMDAINDGTTAAKKVIEFVNNLDKLAGK